MVPGVSAAHEKKSLTSSLSGHLVNGFHLILSFIDDKYVIDDTM